MWIPIWLIGVVVVGWLIFRIIIAFHNAEVERQRQKAAYDAETPYYKELGKAVVEYGKTVEAREARQAKSEQ